MAANQDDLSPSSRSDARLNGALEEIARALRDLRFGQIAVIVQDGVVVQIDRTERHRLPRLDSP